MEYLVILNPAIGILLNIFLQIAILRSLRNLALLKSVLIGFTAGIIYMFMMETILMYRTMDDTLIKIVNSTGNIIGYIIFSYCYFHFINMGETARRIRILSELYYARDGLSLETLLDRYNSKIIVNNRVDRMVNKAQIKCVNNRYYIANPTMLFIARVMNVIKFIVCGKKYNT